MASVFSSLPQSGIFPGCRRNLNWLIRRFFVEQAQPRAGDDSPALAVLDYVLLTVRAWDVEEVNSARQNAAIIMEQHFPGLKEALDAILVKVYIHCPDTKAAVEYARQDRPVHPAVGTASANGNQQVYGKKRSRRHATADKGDQ
ncbi:hypothetical protein KM92DES2_12258 [uncultured Desulfovibrio sp.]|uniref:Uncharacterized protein n=1 Tax=uncultured Desulfovibrio sp. TaxID=167968 RepID=A0A212K5I2_9BACT|nr:hypothetical protein [uncultured Desulfovibrio sp.]SBW06916.1 hypothetical protein KM92DES2_12258 [uncultured Desulfovibrio sp.]